MNLYDALYLASTILTVPYFLFKYAFRGKYHESLPAMLGRNLPPPTTAASRKRGNKAAPSLGVSGAASPAASPVVWVHAVSVGEVVAARSVILPLLELLPAARVIVSTVTETGQAMARKILAAEASRIFYYPLDLSWNVRRFLDAYCPDAFIMMETELWPNMLTLAGRRGVKIFMLNGRLSDRSYPWYWRFRALFKGPLSHIIACAMQTPKDAERMRSLCGPNTRIAVTGNCKFDSPAATLSAGEQATLRRKYLLSEERRVVVAGSTHPGEEEIVLSAWIETVRRIGQATLILAPRHPERFGEAAALVERRGLTCSRSSRPAVADPQVLVLDEMGVLARTYGLGEAGIVCGSFVPIGGHNLLEAAVHAIPVVYGLHMHKQQELLRILDGDHGGIQIAPEELAATLIGLMEDSERRERIGQAARAAVEANRGSARRSVEFILPHITQTQVSGEWVSERKERVDS